MSTTAHEFSLYFARIRVGILLLFLAGAMSAQAKIEVNIKINFDARQKFSAFVSGEFLPESDGSAPKNWSFASSPATAENPVERIWDFNLTDENGRKISAKKFGAGEYLADGAARFLSYNIDLTAPRDSNAASHISWLAPDERGILMLGDLLPQLSVNGNQPVSALVHVDFPDGWTIISREKKIGEKTFAVENVEKAIFFVGRNWREQKISIGKSDVNLAISGEWKFSDGEARQIVGEIYGEYEKMFGDAAGGRIQIALAHFPSPEKFGRWSAETRTANLTVLSGDLPFKAQSLQLLHEQLRHELLHLWIPNRLALSGNYDWFYEGFAIYQALKTGVALNRIRFEDFLETLAQGYDLSRLQKQKTSLIEASKNRWLGNQSGSQIYARAMIVAFLCDTALLAESKGKRSVSDVLKEIYQQFHSPNERRDGNAAILELLKRRGELNGIVEKYVEGAEEIDWKNVLENAGIEQTQENSFTRLHVKSKLSGRQKDLLNELGYNNWRKLSEKQK